MSASKKSSSSEKNKMGWITKQLLHLGSSWFVMYVLIPLIPFTLVTLIKYCVNFTPSFKHFDASNLALSLGFISFLARKSLLDNEILLCNPEKKAKVNTIANWLIITGTIPLGLFVTIETMMALEKSIIIFQCLIMLYLVVILLFFNDLQVSFSLEADAK